jgi:D-alanyl-D-alanine carboxypeptidase (penicillin-binding protein 5/6)
MKKYRISSLFVMLVLVFSVCASPAAALDDPEPNCGAAIVVDGDYGDILYEYNAHEKMYPASITKVMTSLLVMEAISNGKLSLDQSITASASAVDLPEGSSTANPAIQEGEILTVEELLYCDLVTSANEACNILAEAVGGTVDNFVTMMNAKAKELGMTGTHFANPNGLHDEDHYTTAYDISLMARAAMEYETFRTIVSTDRHTVPATNLNGERNLNTTNYLLSGNIIPGYTYSKAIGIKTGFTTPAGYCLASAAVDDDGRTFYCVVLGAEMVDGQRYSFSESKRLLEWAFDNYQRVTLLDDTTSGVIQEVSVTLSDEVDYVIAQPVGSVEATLPTDFDPADVELQLDLPDSVEAPIERGQRLGSVSVVYDGETYGTLDMVAQDAVERSEVQYYVKTAQDTLSIWWVKPAIIAGVALVLFLILYLAVVRPRNKRRRRYTGSGSRSAPSNYRGSRRK